MPRRSITDNQTVTTSIRIHPVILAALKIHAFRRGQTIGDVLDKAIRAIVDADELILAAQSRSDAPGVPLQERPPSSKTSSRRKRTSPAAQNKHD